MTNDTTLTATLVDAWRSGRPLTADAATQQAPANEAAAYATQREVAATLGWFANGRPCAWKVGAPSRDGHPNAAPIADYALRQGPASFSRRDRHIMAGIEVELAVRLAQPLAPGSTPEQVRAAIGEVMVAIEICDARAEAWRTLPPLFRLADQQVNAWLVLGSGISSGWSDDYADGEVVLTINGSETLRSHASHPFGDPLHLLPWLADHAATQYPGGLQAGDIITTGTWTGFYEARPGDHIQARFAGIGEVAVDFADD